MKKLILLLSLLFFISLIIAPVYDDCSIYGNCKPEKASTITINGSGTASNTSNAWLINTTQNVGSGTKSGTFNIDTNGTGIFSEGKIMKVSDGEDVNLTLINLAGAVSIDETVSIIAQTTSDKYPMGKIVFGRAGDYQADSDRYSNITFYVTQAGVDVPVMALDSAGNLILSQNINGVNQVNANEFIAGTTTLSSGQIKDSANSLNFDNINIVTSGNITSHSGNITAQYGFFNQRVETTNLTASIVKTSVLSSTSEDTIMSLDANEFYPETTGLIDLGKGVQAFKNAYFTGKINTDKISASSNITAGRFIGNGSSLTDVCLSNGTNCPVSSGGGNSSWNQSLANSLYISGDNATIYGLINNASYLSTYNVTYAGLMNNASYLSTFNSTYRGCVNNGSYLSTYNITYHVKSNYNFTTNNFNGSGNFNTTGSITSWNDSWIAQGNTSKLYVGYGANHSSYKMHVKTDVYSNSGKVALFEITTNTTGPISAMSYLATTSRDMSDGFGPVFLYYIQDNARVENLIGNTQFVRNGADNSGMFKVQVANAGSSTTRMYLDNIGRMGITNTPAEGTLDIFQVEDTSTGGISLTNQNYDISRIFMDSNDRLNIYSGTTGTNNLILSNGGITRINGGLNVSGNVNVSGSVKVNQNLNVSGNVTAYNYEDIILRNSTGSPQVIIDNNGTIFSNNITSNGYNVGNLSGIDLTTNVMDIWGANHNFVFKKGILVNYTMT